MKLFTKDTTVGIFRGMSEGGLEFHADLVFPYRNEFQCMPMHGQFVLVQLESEQEAVLGRITSFSSQGRLVSSAGEDYGIRAVADERPIPEDLREQYLRYRVDIRVLGVIRNVSGRLVFAPSQRRLPHVGSKVAFLSDEVLQEVAGHNVDGAELGFLALGEFIYADDDKRLSVEDWMVVMKPPVLPKFQVHHLVSRRSFVFARAGFGKSNLIKLLFANLYKTTPTIEKRGNKQVPVGTVIFDPDGEYFWPDAKNRPGLCDVHHLQDKIVVFTNKEAPSDFYGSFVVSSIKMDIRRLRPTDVITIALPEEKQDQQNVRKLKSLNDTDWHRLVDEIYANGNAADPELIKELLRLEDSQEAEMVAARANMTTIVRMLHDPGSQMMDILLSALRDGKICIVDVSQMRGTPALTLSGLVLRRIFNHNQDEFTKSRPETIPTIAVVEEAQAVLSSSRSSGEGPYVEWVKEGRKYDLGAVLITQQPGSISDEILSQGDNWFIFHLLSEGDLRAVKRANAHFSDDLLSSLLNEPIAGHGVFWSSAGGKSYPIPIRGLSFESTYSALDPECKAAKVDCYASRLRRKFESALAAARQAPSIDSGTEGSEGASESSSGDEDKPDALRTYIDKAIDVVRKDSALIYGLKTNGVPWFSVQKKIMDSLPGHLTNDERQGLSYRITLQFLNEVFGDGGWHIDRRPSASKPGRYTKWIVGGKGT